MSWIVYILECGDGSLYTGITNNMTRRLEAHVKGSGAKYTRGRGPFVIRYTETYSSKGEALHREANIKKLDTSSKRALTP